MDLGIAGKLALVVGASRGMGFAVAAELEGAECKVLRVARSPIPRPSGPIEDKDYQVDIGNSAKLQGLISQVIQEHGAPDILVHVTGGSVVDGVPIRDEMAPWSEWEKLLRLNLGAAHEMNRAFLPAMVLRGWGRIVHFSSNGVKLGTGRAPYVTAKHAVEGYVQMMGRAYGPKGVIVSAVRPGPIYTPGLFIYSQSEEWTKAFMEKYVPMGRWGKDEEVAAAVAFLCSRHASYMPSAVIDCDGAMR